MVYNVYVIINNMMKSYRSAKKRLLKDAVIRNGYERLGPEFAVIQKMIDQRSKNGLTQAQLASKIGTKQSAIARFESGSYNPTVQFLHKLAQALDVRLKISID